MAKKVLALVHAYVGHGREAGAETTLANLLESLVEAGWKADVLLTHTYKGLRPYYLNGVHVTPHNPDQHNLFGKIAPEYDALLTHLENSERVSYVGEHLEKPVVQLVHNTMWQTEGYLNENCQLAVFNTEWVKAHHEAVADGGFHRVPQPATQDRMQRISFRRARPKRYNSVVVHPQVNPDAYATSQEGKSILLVNAHANKGPQVFFEMARRFPKERFLLVKGGYGKQELEDVPNVTILSNTPKMRDVYTNTKLVMMPSEYESFGRIALEAAASGIPTIANGTPGLCELSAGFGMQLMDPDRLNDMNYWEEGLKDMLDGRKVGRRRTAALSMSAHWANQRDQETAAFVEAMGALPHLGG